MHVMVKSGKEIKVALPRTKEFRPSQEYEPIDPERVVGIDTESFRWNGKLTTTMIPIHTWKEAVMLDLGPGMSPIVSLFDWLIETFGEVEDRPSRTRQRPKGVRQERDGRKNGRDGRRQTIDPVVLVWYNSEYDLGRLAEKETAIFRAISVGEDAVTVKVGPYELEIVHMCPTGSAPSFEWFIRRGKMVCRIIGRDMWGYWKNGLDATAKALSSMGVTAKIKIGDEVEDAFDRDWLDLSEKEKAAIRKYALQDSKSTREIYVATVNLLMQIDRRVIRKDGTIPASAPGAAAKIAFQKAFDVGDGLEYWRRPPYWASQLGLNAYAGGRVFCRRPGPVTGLYVKDITSAYPDAMRWLPDPARCHYTRIPASKGFDPSEWVGKWGVLVINGEGLDPDYPALRMHDMEQARLRYVVGRFKGLAATIPEIMIGVVSGRLKVDQILDGVVIEGTPETSFLRAYVHEVFDLKARSEKDSPMYLIAKLLMNALYGKLIEVRELNRAPLGHDGYFLVPNVTDWDLGEFRKQMREIYVIGGTDMLEEYFASTVGVAHFLRKRGPKDIPLKAAISGTEYSTGHYFLPLHAAQVTGFVSAKLGLAAAVTGALQGDTDSIFTPNPDLSEYYQVMKEAGYPAPETGLGSFSDEISDATGVLVKTKMYSLITPDGKYKQAHHGIVHLLPPPGTEKMDPKERKRETQKYLHALMVQLLDDGRISYPTKSRPGRLRANVRGQTVKLADGTRRKLDVGEFYSEVRDIYLTTDPNQIFTTDGYFRWKPL